MPFIAAAAAVLMSFTLARAQSLTVYACGPRAFDKKLIAAFEKQSGDTVNLWASSTGKIMARVQAEQSNPHADVLILADQSAGLALQDQGLLDSYRPKRILKRLRPSLNLPSYFVPMGADTVAIVVNTRHLPAGKPPEDWKSLLKPAYKDQVSMPNPLMSGTASDFVLALLQQKNFDGWKYFARIKANGAIWPGPNAAALSPVKLGARCVLMAGVGHTSLKAKKKGNSLTLILPPGGTVLIPRPIVILKSSKHEALAKKFVDFVLSNAGQKLVSKALLIPAVTNIGANPIWPDLDKANFWKVDWRRMAENRAVALKRFDAEVIH